MTPREKETIIQRQIYRRLVNNFEFATDTGIYIPLNIEELERRITADYLTYKNIPQQLLDINECSPDPNRTAPIGRDLSEMPNPEESIIKIHRQIIGDDYISPELLGLSIPIDRKDWENRHAELLRRNCFKLKYA